jgi:hypothetical protein
MLGMYTCGELDGDIGLASEGNVFGGKSCLTLSQMTACLTDQVIDQMTYHVMDHVTRGLGFITDILKIY